MSLLSLIAVFLIEQLHPLPYRRFIREPVGLWADFIESRCNAGGESHAWLGYGLAVLLPVVMLGVLYFSLCALNPLLGLLLNIAVLYVTMGFRQFSHHYTEIQLALRESDLERARALLAEWVGGTTRGLGSADIARLSIEAALAASHRHVFAVLLWFVLLPGPCGALLYRLSHVVSDRWSRSAGESYGVIARRLFAWIDWLPLRVTAAAYAIVGDFEDAVYCWRNQPAQWPDHDMGIVLAAGAGALGVQLGRPLPEGGELADRGELGLGDPADVDFMQSAVGLVWRATLLWILLLFLLGLASLVG